MESVVENNVQFYLPTNKTTTDDESTISSSGVSEANDAKPEAKKLYVKNLPPNLAK